MNCLLLAPDEVGEDGEFVLRGNRARHIELVLKARPGQRLRAGIIDGPLGSAEVLAMDGEQVRLRWTGEGAIPARPAVDILLAVPRPKVMRRLWAPLAGIGVGHIVLVNAEKVERNYFDTHWLEPATYQPLLVEGLAQCGDTRLPSVAIRRRLKPFLEDELEALFPTPNRLITHPRAEHDLMEAPLVQRERMLLAIGPEGGWSDYEQDLFAARGFRAVHLGPRVLRSDTACIALLAVAHAKLRDGNEKA